jgi:hypothetical protein
MKTKRHYLFMALVLLALATLHAPLATAHAQGTAFTYQGRVTDNGAAANGSYDLQFTIYDALAGGSQMGGPLTSTATAVSNGLFTVTLDFGADVFNGSARWLDIGVRTNGPGAFTTLIPRNSITPTPYAIYAANAGSAATATTATTAGSATSASTATTANNFSGSLSGDVTGTQGATVVASVGGQTAANVASGASAANSAASLNIANTIVKRDPSGNFSAGIITANLAGNATTATTATNLIGNVSDARLSTNVALLTIPNTSASATATPIINSGFITGANVTSGGSGYVTAPTVTINDSTGSGAVITASISGGSVVSLTVQNPGSSYSGGTTLTLTPPPSNAYQVFSSMNIFNGVNTFTNTSNGFTGSFTGNGAGLTNLGAINLSGIVPDARLSANVALLNGSPNFSGAVTASSFSGSGTSLTGLNASQLASGTVPAAALGNAWQVGGNSGTTPGTQFVGTTDNQALEFKVNGSRALRLEPNATSPNVIGGYSGNYIAAGLVGAAISGGGLNGYTNSIFANYSAIGGGYGNTIQPDASLSTIGGGYGNTIQPSASLSTIGGGQQNTIQTSATFSTIGGGYGHTIQTSADDSTIGGGHGNTIQFNASYSTIGGGVYNTIQTNASISTIGGGNQNMIQTGAIDSTIGGGQQNTIQPNASVSTIGGGYQNTIQTNAIYSTIGGGDQNTIEANASFSTIGGGNGNRIQTNASSSTIGGGVQNTIQTNASDSTIGGGYDNTIQPNTYYSAIGGGYINTIQPNASDSTIGGGMSNTIQTNAQYAVIPGGKGNVAANYAFAAGYNARATNTGAFVWSDSTGTLTPSTGANSVTMRASGGFSFLTGTSPVGASLAAGGTAWGVISDRNAKKNFQPLDGLEVLEKLSAIPVQHWNYKWESDDAVPHIGPMAQDFKSAFYPGRDDKSITTLEFDGVELAAIQGLNQKLNEKDAEIQNLEKKLDELQAVVKQLVEKK